MSSLGELSLEELEEQREMLMLELQYRPGTDERWAKMAQLTKRIKQLNQLKC